MNLTTVQPKFGQLNPNQKAQLNNQFTQQIPIMMDAKVALESLEVIGEQLSEIQSNPDGNEFRQGIEDQIISMVERLSRSPLGNIALAGLTRAIKAAPFQVSDALKNAFKTSAESVNAEPTGLLMDDIMSGVRPPADTSPADLETFQKAKSIMQGFRDILIQLEDTGSQNPEAVQTAETQLKTYIQQATEMSTGNVMLAFMTNALEDCSHPVSEDLFASLKSATEQTKALAAGSLLML